MKLSPRVILFSYILAVIVFAFIYRLTPELLSRELTWVDSFYFSIVTITTLGYGDIAPVSAIGKTVVSLQALFGVLVLGVLLVSVGQRISDSAIQSRVVAAKGNFIIQYENWREDISLCCFFLAASNGLDSNQAKELADATKFRTYFDAENRWKDVLNALANDHYYATELLRSMAKFERVVRHFISVVPLSDTEILRRLTALADSLHRFQSLDLNEYDDRKYLGREIWQYMTHWNVLTGYSDRDPILETLGMV